MPPSVTLQTVADALGVSRTTVSNAYSRPDQLSDDLRQRILATAAELGYHGPHPAARTLRRGRAGAIGVVLTEELAWAFADPYAVAFLGGLATEAEQARHSLLLIPCPPGEDQTEGVRNAVVDGFCVVTMPDDHPIVQEVVARGLPAVFVDGPLLDHQRFVGIDDRGGMAEIARHLLDHGHRRFAVLAFRFRPDGRVGFADDARLAEADFRVTRERLAGALDTLAAAGIRREDVPVYEAGINTVDTGRLAAHALLALEPRPTAILCLSDRLAIGALAALTEAGLRAPADVSVAGFDGIDAAEAAGLTTVCQPSGEKGRAAGAVLAAVDGPMVLLLGHELVVRSSTGPAPG